MTMLWIAFLAGASLALAFKLLQYYRRGGVLVEYFLGDHQSSLTTVTTFGVVWLLGAITIRVFTGELALWATLAGLPAAPCVFVIGSIAEFAAPRWIQRVIQVVGGDQ
jgi:hypothetical protein